MVNKPVLSMIVATLSPSLAMARGPVEALCELTSSTSVDRSSVLDRWDLHSETCRLRARELDSFVRRGVAAPDGLVEEAFTCASLAELAGERAWPSEGRARVESVAFRPSGCRKAEGVAWGRLVDDTRMRLTAGDSPSAPPPASEPDYTWAWVATGTAVATLVGGSVLVSDAMGVSDRLDLEQARGADASLLGDLHDRRVAEMAGGGVLLGLGAVATGIAIWQLVEPPDASRTRATIVPTVSASGAGLVVRVGLGR